jgi:hypothetical protein
MAATMEQFFKAVDAANIRHVAVDLRSIRGGDSTVAFAFLAHFSDIVFDSFSVELRFSKELAAAEPAFGREAMSAALQAAGLPPIPDNALSFRLPAPFVSAILRARMQQQDVGSLTRVEGRKLYLLTDAGTYSSGTLFAALVRDNGIGVLVGEPTGNPPDFNGSELRFALPGTDYYLNIPSARLLRPDASRGQAPAMLPDVPLATTRVDLRVGRDPQLEYLLAQGQDNHPDND